MTSLHLHHPHQPDPLPSIAALTALQELTVSYADIGAAAAESLVALAGRLTKLTALGLPACALQAVPDSLWALPRLQVRLIEGRSVCSSVPSSYYSQPAAAALPACPPAKPSGSHSTALNRLLQMLDLSENYLQGGLPGAAAEAPGLTRLVLDLRYAAEGGMQLGRLAALRALALVWRPADLPGRLCEVLPRLRPLTALRTLQLLRHSSWQPGGSNLAPKDCPAVVSGLEELVQATGRLSVSLSRY